MDLAVHAFLFSEGAIDRTGKRVYGFSLHQTGTKKN